VQSITEATTYQAIVNVGTVSRRTIGKRYILRSSQSELAMQNELSYAKPTAVRKSELSYAKSTVARKNKLSHAKSSSLRKANGLREAEFTKAYDLKLLGLPRMPRKAHGNAPLFRVRRTLNDGQIVVSVAMHNDLIVRLYTKQIAATNTKRAVREQNEEEPKSSEKDKVTNGDSTKTSL